ncbi:ZG8-like protein, partial [Mya arenaria]
MGKCKAQKETKVSQTEMAISLIRNAHSSVSEIENDSELPEIQIPIKQEVQKQDGTVCDLNLMRSRRGSVRSKEKQNACIQSEEVSLNEVAHLIEEVKSEVTDLMDDTENGGFGGTDQPICLESSSMTRKRDCSRSNTSKRKLIRKAPKSDENFNCKICDKTFSTKYVYQKHMAVHSGEKPYSCEICGALFSLREYLTSHMTCHSAERKFKCDECGAAFFRRGNLIAHKQSHTGHKPYTCEKCGKCFPYNQSLQEHMLRHKGEMPVSCDRCGKRFNNVRQLKAHSKYHELRTDFHCSLCNLYYESLKSLKKHCYMSHATDHSCEFCGEKFSNKRVLASHRFKQHKDKRESRKRKVDIEAVIEDKAKDTDRIITLRLQEEKGKENYKVYYKDEEMDVFVTVKDGDKGLTNESADEIVDREQSEEVKL